MLESNRLRIPLVDLRAQYASIREEIDEAIDSVIRDSAFIGGPYLKAFEQQFASYCRVPHVVGVSNGTEALRLALLGCGIGAGDEVITVPNTFIATTEAIRMVGAEIRFVDVEPSTHTLDPDRLKAVITSRTRAVIPVHLYGRPAEMDPVLDLARTHGFKVIGDAAQAHGAEDRGRSVASLGDVACFSFYPGKNLGAYGDAGAVATSDSEVAERISMMRDHGRTGKYEHVVDGFNSRMDGLQAAILSVKLRHLPRWTERRRQIAALYSQRLADVPGLAVPREETQRTPVFHLYVVEVEDRTPVQAFLKEQGIETGIHYPIPLHRQPVYGDLGLSEGSFPVSERLAKRVLSLPLYPEMTEDQVNFVVDQVRTAVRAGAPSAG